eukprot:2995094-Rhodomonas_salina.2
MHEDKRPRRRESDGAQSHGGAEPPQREKAPRSREGGRAQDGNGHGRVERDPSGQQRSDARGFPIPIPPDSVQRELLTGRYAALWESADRPRAFLASGELGFLHARGGGVKPSTLDSATQMDEGSLLLRSGR